MLVAEDGSVLGRFNRHGLRALRAAAAHNHAASQKVLVKAGYQRDLI